MSFTTWVRAQDAYGQFDVRKGDDLREGVTLVPNYPEHVGFTGRPGKARVELGAALSDGYSAMTVALLKQDLDARNEAREEDAPEIVSNGTKKADLIAALEADDAAREERAAAEASDAQPSDTGDNTTTTDAGTGAESE